MKKKILSVVLCIIMVLSIFSIVPFSVSAGEVDVAEIGTSKTADEAINWVKSKVGYPVGYNDGSGEYQCVELIQEYYRQLGVNAVSGNGCDYAWNSLPSGWTRTAGGQPQKGDILVYTDGGYGHVAIYESDYSFYQQNYNYHPYVEHSTFKYNDYNMMRVSYWGCIHPDFKSSAPGASFSDWSNDNYTFISTTNAALGQSIVTVGGTFESVGMILYTETGILLAQCYDTPVSGINKYYFNINTELKYTLSPGTKYKYRFYASVGGYDFYSEYKTFSTIGTNVNFSDWSNDAYTFIGTTNASLGQSIVAIEGTLDKVGLYLYSENGSYIEQYKENAITGESKYYFNINKDLGYTLSPGTTYQYRFYASVGGKDYYSSYKNFTTQDVSVTFTEWNDNNYTYIGATNASLGQVITPSSGNLTKVGIYLYTSDNDNYIGKYEENAVANETRYYFNVNNDLGVTLSPNTRYRYIISATIGSKVFYSKTYFFTTTKSDVKDITFDELWVLPSKNNVFISCKVTASSTVNFTQGSLTIWDINNNRIVYKVDNVSIDSNNMPLWYDVVVETGVQLQKGTKYKYQLTATANGKEYKSAINNFETENNNGNHFGIDVSQHQGKIDWEKVSAQIDYAIIRCGYGSDNTNQDDKYWEYNVTECERLGIPYGVYLYSYAEDDTEAKSEAAHTLRLLEGHSPDLPIYYDLEDVLVEKLGSTQICKQANIYCDIIEKAGYKAGIYSSEYWWNNILTSRALDKYDKWLASWDVNFPTNIRDYNQWQYSSNGKINGIIGVVDLDYSLSGILTSKIKGDTDKDGEITIMDATFIQKYLAKLIDETKIDLIAADYDQNGIVDITDATGIQKYLAGIK